MYGHQKYLIILKNKITIDNCKYIIHYLSSKLIMSNLYPTIFLVNPTVFFIFKKYYLEFEDEPEPLELEDDPELLEDDDDLELLELEDEPDPLELPEFDDSELLELEFPDVPPLFELFDVC